MEARAQARYVRIFCYGNYPVGIDSKIGFTIRELEVYAYKDGDPQPTYTIPELPEIETVGVEGSDATYSANDIRFPNAKP